MKTVHFALAITALSSAVACSIYRTSDRDDFDTNGRSRAPAGAALVACVPNASASEDRINQVTYLGDDHWAAFAQVKKQNCEFSLDNTVAALPFDEMLQQLTQVVDFQP